VAGATPFAFETGFRAAERRVSLVARSDAHGVWQPFVGITEQLGRCAERPPAVESPALPQGWRGLRRSITPDLRVSPAEPIAWCRLEEVGEDRLTVRVPGGLAVSLPLCLAPGQPLVGIVEWAVDAMTVHRGIRTYEATGVARFSSTSLPTNNNSSGPRRGSVQAHHETCAGTRSRVERHGAVSCAW
jgi:hypothetical protein